MTNLIPKKIHEQVHRKGKIFGRTRTVWIKPQKGTIATLAGVRIPPAWKNVWIAADKNNELQAMGTDSKGRKQYLYSQKHTGKAAKSKFNRLKAFVKEYPKLIQKIEKDVNKREEAVILYLIAKTGFRIGSMDDTKATKQAYGASTLLGKHINISGDKVSFSFIGKKGVQISKTTKDPLLAKLLSHYKKASNIPLFTITDNDVRKYLGEITNKPFVIKDFRTYMGTSSALKEIKKMPVPETKTGLKRAKKLVATTVSKILGNTPAMALKAYIAPEIFSSWEAKMEEFIKKSSDREEDIEEFIETIQYDEGDDEDWEKIKEVEDSDDEDNIDKFLSYLERK